MPQLYSLPSSMMAPMAESTNWLGPIFVDLQPLMQRIELEKYRV